MNAFKCLFLLMIPVLRLIETAFIIKTLVGCITGEYNSNPRNNRETAKHILCNSGQSVKQKIQYINLNKFIFAAIGLPQC